MVKMPDFLTSFVAMSTKLLITWVQAFCSRPCSVASAFIKAPFVIAFAPAFIDFMGGSMMAEKVELSEGQIEILLC